MPDRIIQPGLYDDIDPAAYHADPAPDPSLSNSVAQILLARSPWHAWHAHPRLNPNHAGDDGATRRLDLGSIAHALLLGKSKGVEVIDAEDYKTKDARAQRDAARAAGKLPILTVDYERAMLMTAVAQDTIRKCKDLGRMYLSGVSRSEPVVLWQDDGAWCRAMIDRTDMGTVMDYKTCPNASPAAVARHLYSQGYHIQRAWYLRALDAIDKSGVGRRRFLFLFQEIDEPFACTVTEIDGTGAVMGERQVDQALRIWRECMATGQWPSYPLQVHRAEMPPWMEASILAQEIAEDERRNIPQGQREPMLNSLMGG